jgi:hypothetical protein
MDDPTLKSLLETYAQMYVSEDKDPCWDTHKQDGMKKKGGKMVPNCVPKEEVEAYDIVLDYLIQEGYAKDTESADTIMSVMSQNKIQEIVSNHTIGD